MTTNEQQQMLEEQIVEDQTLVHNKQKRPSIMDMIKEKQNDQDFNQKLNVGITLILEIYRVLMGAFLVVFVPQKCGDTICSASQNINRGDSLSQSAISFNIITSLSFLALYFIEVKRENKMINYLEVNTFTATDNDSVGVALERLAVSKKQSIWDYDGYYQKSGYASTVAFTLNAILSFIVVYKNYLDSKTITVFLTNLLLMGLKVADVFSTVNTPKNIFYSAYLKNKVQFNDVDPDKIQLIKDESSNTIENTIDNNQMDVDGEPKVEQLPDEEMRTVTEEVKNLPVDTNVNVSTETTNSTGSDDDIAIEVDSSGEDSQLLETPVDNSV